MASRGRGRSRFALAAITSAGVAALGIAGFGALPAAAASATPGSCGPRCTQIVVPASVRSGTMPADTMISSALRRARSGWTVQLPAGVLRVAAPIVVPDGVNLAGSGIDHTTVLLDRRAWDRFSFDFVISPAPRTVRGSTIRDLTVDGNRIAVDRIGASARPAANQGGGVKLGNAWQLRNLRLSNLNYFKVWAKDVSGVRVEDCRFEERRGGFAGGQDNIGGGGVRGAVIRNNLFAATARGNAVDIVRGKNVRIEGNRIQGTSTAPHNLYLEGVTDSSVIANELLFSSISVQSNGGYRSQREVVNPSRVVIEGNHLTAPAVQGISLRYDEQDGVVRPAGGNRIAGNEVTGSGVAGIVVMAAGADLVQAPDVISGNTVVDAFSRGVDSWNTGYGITNAAGIVIGVARGSDVSANSVVDTRDPARTDYGVQFGLRSSRAVPVDIGREGGNRVSGVPQARFVVTAGN